MIGTWKNVEELEECLTLQELEKIVAAAREQEVRQNKFLAALKGIDLEEGDSGGTSKFEEVEERVQSRIRQERAQSAGLNPDHIDYVDMGFEVEGE